MYSMAEKPQCDYYCFLRHITVLFLIDRNKLVLKAKYHNDLKCRGIIGLT